MEYKKAPYMITEDTRVVVYSHEHGTDTWLADNRKLAEKSVYQEMLEWIDDLDSDDVPHLLDLIEKDLFDDACNYWCDKTEESFGLDGSTFLLIEEMSEEVSEEIAMGIASVRKVRAEEE